MDRKGDIEMIESIKATVRTDLSLWQVWQNRNEARERWLDIAFVQYGWFLPEVVVSRSVYHLIIVLMAGKGIMASGNWLDIGMTLTYHVALDDETMMIKNVEEGTLEFLTGGKIVGINYKGLKKFASQEGRSEGGNNA